MATLQNGHGSASGSMKYPRPSLATLPSETLETIFSYARPCDLARLACVSKGFHELAAAQLYHTLGHVFNDDDRRDGQLSVDYLAGVLETLTTADYNYAQFIKVVSIDTDTDSRADHVAREFKYDYTCGKFLNTLMLATLKKVTVLESFRWNIRVEIGQSMFLVLSKMATLQNLHIRLQPGPSLHSQSIINVLPHPPPPSTTPHSHQTSSLFSNQPHNNNVVFVPTPNPPPFNSYMPGHKPTPGFKNVRLTRRLGISKLTASPRNISRFSGLRSLAVLEIGSHEYIPEIATCVSASSSSLKSLKLSFSESLAMKARRKAVTEIPDAVTVLEDTESDDFFQGIAPPPPPPPLPNTGNAFGSTTASSSTSQAEIRKERVIQEKAFAQILGLHKPDPSQTLFDQLFERAIFRAYKDAKLVANVTLGRDHDRHFIEKVKEIAADFHSNKSSIKGHSSKSLRSLERLEKAAKRYLEREDLLVSLPPHNLAPNHKDKPKENNILPTAEANQKNERHTSEDAEQHFRTKFDHHYYGYLEKVLENSSHPPVFPFDWNDEKDHSKTPESGDHTQDSDINIFGTQPLASDAAPETSINATAPFDGANESDLSVHLSSMPAGIFGVPENQQQEEMSDIVDMEHPDVDEDSGDDQESIEDADEWDHQVEESVSIQRGASSSDAWKGKQPVGNGLKDADTEQSINQYLQANHGLPLEELAIHLIPVKPTVLSRGIDLSSLRHLALLNVGIQDPFWSMLAKSSYPLNMTSIHTDNVTHPFLQFLESHHAVTELFLFERSRKSKLPSLTSRTSVTIEHIRQHVLKRHAGTLRRLIIRNDDDAAWALNRQGILTLTRKGHRLEELMVGLNSINLHFFVQHISALQSLFALQILYHSRDGCSSVVRELRCSIADTIVHCPTLSIKYVGICLALHVPESQSVTYLHRAAHNSGSARFSEAGVKGNGKAIKGIRSAYDRRIQEIIDEWATEVSDDETDDGDGDPGVEIDNDFKMSDVVGVKMWERETWGMRI